MKQLNVIFGLIVLAIFLTTSAFAQEIPIESPNVDPTNVSDQQIRDGLERAQQQGLSQQQIESLARARGLSESQIASLRQRVESLTAEKGAELSDAELREELSQYERNEDDFNREIDIDEINGRIFGEELFNNQGLTFSPSVNIPTPVDYKMGPGDEIIIDIWGASENTYQLTVGPEGFIKVPQIGPIFINGLDVATAAAKIETRLSQIYQGLTNTEDRKKDTYVQVSLGRIRSIKVNIIGRVKKPGTYTISSLSTIIHALYQAGGPTKIGSYRNITLVRNGKTISNFDLYKYLLEGNVADNFTLKDQDIIIVPFYENQVKLSGEVRYPALYEFKENESLADILNYAGYLTAEGYNGLVTIDRKTEKSRKLITIKSGQFHDVGLVSGDLVTFSRIYDSYENRVSIQGAVWRPGDYELTDSLTLSELIVKAEGLTADAFRGRGQIVRYKKDLTLQNINFNVDEVLNGKVDFYLFPEDRVLIKSKTSLEILPTIRIQGAVKNPNEMSFQEDLSIEDIIFKAGGFLEDADKTFVEVARRPSLNSESDDVLLYQVTIDGNLAKDSSDVKFEVLPFDIITVRKSPKYNELQTVVLEGEFLFPGRYVLKSNTDRVSDLIRRAGGLTDEAYTQGGSMIRTTEYYDETSAAKLKISRLNTLEKLDTTSLNQIFDINKRESIAIELDEIIKNPESEKDLLLKDGDVISVPKKLQTVRVRGEVYFMNNIIYDNKKGMMDYISEAGGATDNANLKKAYVIYQNGSAERTKSFLWTKKYPKVTAGSEVIIPSKPERRRLSSQEIIGLSSSVLTMVLVFDRLTNK